MTENNTDAKNTTTNDRLDTEALVGKVVDVGLAWARTGLTMGRAALETSAKSLSTTAEALGSISDALERDAAEQKTEARATVAEEPPVDADKPAASEA